MSTKIIRSEKLKSTAGARRVDGDVEIIVPGHLSDKELQPVIVHLRRCLTGNKQRQTLDDAELDRLAKRLNAKYFQNKLLWASITWDTRLNTTLGKCHLEGGKSSLCFVFCCNRIRISHRVAAMPQYVKEYIVMHELSHIMFSRHDTRFEKLVHKYPHTKQAREYIKKYLRKLTWARILTQKLNKRIWYLLSAGLDATDDPLSAKAQNYIEAHEQRLQRYKEVRPLIRVLEERVEWLKRGGIPGVRLEPLYHGKRRIWIQVLRSHGYD